MVRHLPEFRRSDSFTPTVHSTSDISGEKTLTRRLASAFLSRAGWSIVAAVLARATPLFAIILVARTLGKESVGIISMVQTTAMMGGGFVGVGLGMSISRILAEQGNHHPSRSHAAILLHSVTALAALLTAAVPLAIGARYFARSFFDNPSVAPFLIYAVPLLVLLGYQQYQSGILAGLGAFRPAAVANGITVAFSWPMIVYAVSYRNLTIVLWSMICSAVLACLISHRMIHVHCNANGMRTTWREAWSHRSLLWTIGFPCLLLNMVQPPVDWLSFQLLLKHPSGIAEVGVYTAANYWCMLVLFLPLNLSSAVLTMASATRFHTDAASRKTMLLLSFGVSTVTGIVFCGLLCLFSPFIMSSYGPDFRDRWQVLALLLVAGVFLGIQITAERIQVAFDGIWTGFVLKVLVGVAYLVGVVLLLNFGADGMALSRMLCAIIAAAGSVMVLAWRIRRLTGPGLPIVSSNDACKDQADRATAPTNLAIVNANEGA